METFGLHLEDGDDINERMLKKTQDGRQTAVQKAYDSLKDKDGYCFKTEVVDKALSYGCFTSRGQCDALMVKLSMEAKLTEKNKMIKINFN